MATRRTPLNRRAHRQITDAAVDAFRLGDWLQLHRALGLRPWEASPLDAADAEPPDWMLKSKFACDDWRQAFALRLELAEAAKQ